MRRLLLEAHRERGPHALAVLRTTTIAVIRRAGYTNTAQCLRHLTTQLGQTLATLGVTPMTDHEKTLTLRGSSERSRICC